MRICKTLVTALAVVALGTSLALAAASDLDSTFGLGGRVVTVIGAESDHLSSTVIQPDGKIVVGGDFINGGGGGEFALVRYNSDGSLDTTFDGDGKVIMPIGPSNDHITAIALQPDGKIVAAGSRYNGSNPDFGIARFNPNGSLDTSFDGDGIQYTPIGSSTDVAFDVALQPDGKIVAVGQSYGGGFNDTAAVRYNADGSLDTSFSGDGKVVVPISANSDLPLAVTVQPDGKIVTAGTAGASPTSDFAFMRLNSDGSLDTGFDGDGKLVLSIGSGNDNARGLIAQPDGKLVAVGESNEGTFDISLVRLNADGSLDGSFDGDGKVTTPIGTLGDSAYDVRQQFNGKLVVVGATQGSSNNDTVLTRYNADGSLDGGFDGDGILVTPAGASHDFGYALAIQPDGKIVAAGDTMISVGNYDFAVQRFIGDPPPPAVPAPAPSTTITSPGKRVMKRKKLKRFAGTAGPAGQVAKVEIALRKIDRRALKRKRCLWLKNNKAKFVKTKANSKKCSAPRFLKASGTDSWNYRLKRKLAKGSYELYVRVTLSNGATHASFDVTQGNYRKFRLR